MSADPQDVRRLKARLAGELGGPAVQKVNKALGKGWFNSQQQRLNGIKGASKNREQQTGAWDSANLEKANQVLKEKGLYTTPERFANLAQGRQTQKQRKINVNDPIAQRRKSLQFHGIVLDGKHYSLDTEQRTYVSDTTLDYYLVFAPKKKKN